MKKEMVKMTIKKKVSLNYFELLAENERLNKENIKLMLQLGHLKNKVIVLSRQTGEGEVLDITEQGRDWIVKDPKLRGKSKSTVIPNSNVKLIYDLIMQECDIKDTISYRELVPLVIAEHNAQDQVDVDSFSGGKWRRHEKGYFKTYFFPVKILVHLGVIHHDKRGNITRLK